MSATTQTDGNQPNTPQQRLHALAHEAVAAQGEPNDAAREAFRGAIEEEVELILAVVGDKWPDICNATFRRILLSAHGRQLATGAKMPPHGQRRKAAVAAEMGLLSDYQINGKPLGICTRAEVVAEQGLAVTRATFLYAICKLLPRDDAVVKDHVSSAQAAELLRQAERR
jgi:hypothetical protein